MSMRTRFASVIPSWHRVKLIPQLFDQGYDYVLWIDADALFMRFDRDIADVIDGSHDLYLVRHKHAWSSTLAPNCGVMLIRNTPWSRDFFARLWSMEQYASHYWWENAALISALGYHSLLREGADVPDADLLAHIRFLDTEWNVLPWMSEARNQAIIFHYAGGTSYERKRLLPGLALKATRRAFAQCGGDIGAMLAIARQTIPMTTHILDLRLRFALRRHPSILSLIGRAAFE